MRPVRSRPHQPSTAKLFILEIHTFNLRAESNKDLNEPRVGCFYFVFLTPRGWMRRLSHLFLFLLIFLVVVFVFFYNWVNPGGASSVKRTRSSSVWALDTLLSSFTSLCLTIRLDIDEATIIWKCFIDRLLSRCTNRSREVLMSTLIKSRSQDSYHGKIKLTSSFEWSRSNDGVAAYRLIKSREELPPTTPPQNPSLEFYSFNPSSEQTNAVGMPDYNLPRLRTRLYATSINRF